MMDSRRRRLRTNWKCPQCGTLHPLQWLAYTMPYGAPGAPLPTGRQRQAMVVTCENEYCSFGGDTIEFEMWWDSEGEPRFARVHQDLSGIAEPGVEDME